MNKISEISLYSHTLPVRQEDELEKVEEGKTVDDRLTGKVRDEPEPL